MQNRSNISSLWDTMSLGCTEGLVKRLLPVTAPIKIFGTYRYPERIYGIAFSYSRGIKLSVEPFKNLKELDVILLEDSTYNTNKLLTIQLSSNANIGVFACLCDNLVDVVQKCPNEPNAVKTVMNQLEHWKTMFDRSASEGLTVTEQQGLYGELTYLHKLICKNIFATIDVLRMWVGVDKAMRDFQGDNWAVEVKTVSTNNVDLITINGERQLDETLLDKLFLYHLAVEASKMTGQTLNDRVDELRQLLKDDIVGLNIFNTKLLEAGYFEQHRNLYTNRCYKIRKENIYRITNDFPRIREAELRDGVSDAVYSINISNCAEYMVSESEHFNSMK